MNRYLKAIAIPLACSMLACSSAYYATWEKLGYEKRDLLHSSIEAAREDQLETVAEFKDALTALRASYNFKNTELQDFYDRLKAELEDSEHQAKTLKERIRKMDKLAADLFSEWKQEAESIETASLRNASLQQRTATKQRYERLSQTLSKSSQAMNPVLKQLKDYVLYLKHNLNAQSIGALKGEAQNITEEMEQLTSRMSSSVREIDDFLRLLENTGTY